MNILISDDVHPLLIKGLEEGNFAVSYRPEIKREEVLKIIAAYELIVINTKISMDKAMFDASEKLRSIVRLGSGLDNIDLKIASERNIQVFNTPEGNANAVGEHALSMLLAMFNNLCEANRGVKNREWQREANRGV